MENNFKGKNVRSIQDLKNFQNDNNEQSAIGNYFAKEAKKEDDFTNWLGDVSRIQGRPVEATPDYDMKSYFESIKSNVPGEGTHFPDDFKTPEHATFSQMSNQHVPVIKQGGQWLEDSSVANGWKFKPSQLNIDNMGGRENLQKYFNHVESPEALDLPNNQKFTQETKAPMSVESNSRLQALRKLSNGR